MVAHQKVSHYPHQKLCCLSQVMKSKIVTIETKMHCMFPGKRILTRRVQHQSRQLVTVHLQNVVVKINSSLHPKISLSLTKKQQGRQHRSFNVWWYRDFQWLTFCPSWQQVFCFYYQKAAVKGLFSSVSCIDNSLVTKHFNIGSMLEKDFKAMKKVRYIEKLSTNIMPLINNLQ